MPREMGEGVLFIIIMMSIFRGNSVASASGSFRFRFFAVTPSPTTARHHIGIRR